jgi:hypothetical protein
MASTRRDDSFSRLIPSNLTIQQTMERVYTIQTRAAGKLLALNEAGLRVNSLSEQQWLGILR